ncbi:ABC transporter permease subunit [Sinorhizobium medicae]|uniref:ABC transporter permease subunit n=1 Tax=Sinorhizobium medicae TaxID=110321 RepID=UPI003C754CE2
MSLPLSIAFCLATGAVAGAFNGLMVAYLGIPSIVATLGTLGLYRGIMLVLTGGRWIEDLPQGLKALAANLGFGFSILTIVVLALVALAWIVLRKTRFGRISTRSAITARPPTISVYQLSWCSFPLSSQRASAPPSPASSSPPRSASSQIRPATASN